ncbi:MAG: DoxX family protein [Pseudomonadota bacterium]
MTAALTRIVAFHDRVFAWIDSAISSLLLPTAARLVFAGVLLMYFWRSGVTKLGDGLFGFVNLGAGTYVQMFPLKMEAVGYDPSALGFGLKLVALLGTWAEFILPLMIVIGFGTRLAALGMIGFVIVQSATDIVGHHADAATVGSWFDTASDALIVDQRAFWIFLLLFLALRGGGPLSVDYFLGIGRAKPQES